MPKVSVIIAAYNAMEYLPETLNSVLQQSFQDFEVVIVDDGSTDHIKSWASNLTDSRIRFISQPNQGPSVARNTGIINSSANYLAFLDADDLWQSSKLSKQVEVLDNDPTIGIVYSWVSLIDESGTSKGRLFINTAEGIVWDALVQHNIIECGSNPMVRRECFDSVGMFDVNLRYCQERDMWLRISRNYPFAVISEPLVFYRQHSTSHSKNWEASEKCTQVLLERAFGNPPETVSAERLQKLRQLSYGRAALNFAWKPLQSSTRDYKIAQSYCKRALSYCPTLLFSKEYLRLSIAINLMRILGPESYQKALKAFFTVRRRSKGLWKSLVKV